MMMVRELKEARMFIGYIKSKYKSHSTLYESQVWLGLELGKQSLIVKEGKFQKVRWTIHASPHQRPAQYPLSL